MSSNGWRRRVRRVLPDVVRRRYLAKFAVAILLIGVLTLGAAMLLLGNVQADVTQNAHEEVKLTAENDAEGMAEWIDKYRQETHMLSSYEEMKHGDESEIPTTMDEELRRLPAETHSIHYIDYETDEIVSSTDESMVGQDLTTMGIDLHVLDEEGAVVEEAPYEEISREQYDSTYGAVSHQGQGLVVFISPIEGTDKGVLIFTERSKRAELFTDPVEGQNTQVVNLEDARVLMDANESTIGTDYPGGLDSPVVQAVESNGSGSMELDDRDAVVGYAPIEGTDWAVITHAPKENALAVVSDVRTNVLGIIAIALLGFVAVGATIGRNTARTLERVSEQARSLAHGEVDISVETSGRVDEMGQLQESVADTQAYLQTVTAQADAIAEQNFDAEELQTDVPGTLGDSLDEMQRDLEEFITEVERARDEARESEQKAQELVETLERQATQFGDVLARVADGDFTQRLDTDIDNDAMSDIATTVNEMLADIEATIGEIQEFSQEVAAASQQANAGASEVKRTAEQVSGSIQEIATGADDQREKLETVAGEMNTLSATIQESTSTAQTVAATSQQTADIATNGEDVAEQAIEEMEGVQETIASTVENVETLDELMTEIDEIVELIGDIAEQTNMLALNANIEAARAGESGNASGNGFAVVADEVKQLAEETQDSAEDVASLIEEVQSQTGTTVDEIQTAQRRVEETTESVQEAVDAFVDVVENIEDTNDGIQEISKAMDDQAHSSEDVVTMVDDVTEIAESTAEESETVSAAAEEQASSMTQVSSNVESLLERAERLESRLERFEVDGANRADATDSGDARPTGGPEPLTPSEVSPD